ncbi:uncharacterized protein [Primulina huaijiensis]|uniref:uncharacterized protein n=1 Tax=Primulina huaijiensis TaxID=1492673 RepID=UPI003CC75B73
MDGFSCYNQIKIAEANTHKTTFRCSGAVGTFEWLVKPFGLKNTGATYQRTMNSMFHDMIGHHIEVYIDDIVVKSKQADDHIERLRKSFQIMRQHELKLNPLKCAFGVKAGNFLGFLTHPLLRIGKWSLALTEFTLTYYPQKSVKGQAIADFLADYPSLDEFIGEQVGFPVCGVGVQPWGLKFDGSSTETAAEAGIVITSPRGVKTALSFNLGFSCTNNQAEYEVLVIGLEILKDLGAKELLISWDSQLVLKQLSGEFKCTSLSLASYYTAASQLLDDFEEVSLVHVSRPENWEADELPQVASGLKMSPELTHRLVLIQKRNHPSIQQRGIQVDTLNLDINLAGDWRDDIKQVLELIGRDIPHGLKMRSLNYVLVEGDLYRKGLDGLLLRCIGFTEALEIMKKVHEGVCGAHQYGVKMRWLIRRYGYYWPSILKDGIKYAKGCQPCQKHGNIRRIPTDELHSVVKLWPFKGWAMDSSII